MSGHSKWHCIKHKKAITDGKKGKVLTKHAKLLAIVGRGDPNPETNSSLRVAIQNAKADSVPKENIDRILKKLAGEGKNSAQFSEHVYEGYGPEGVPFLVTALTDNPLRTLPLVRVAFQKHGGNFGSSGAVMFLFDHVGVISIKNAGRTEDQLFELAIDAGADNFEFGEEESEITTKFTNLAHVRDALMKKGVEVLKSEPQYRAKDPKIVSGATLEKVERFVEVLEEIEDVDEVFGGFDVE